MPEIGGSKLEDMVRLIVEMAEQYHDCAARHKALADATDG